MPSNDNPGGPWGGGSNGGGPRRPWGQQPPPPAPRGGEDLEDMLRRLRERFFGAGRGGGANRGTGGGRRGVSWPLIAVILLVGWIATGTYFVNEGEQAVVTRFGRYDRTTGPGPQWHLPAPIEAAQKVNVTGQRSDEIGCETRGNSCEDIPDESLMITGDRNIVEIHFRTYYNIANVRDFAFNVRNPTDEGRGGERGAVRQVAESAMREVIGQRQLEQIITTDRGAVEQSVQQLMQQVLNDYQSGVRVLQVQLLSAAAPPAVIEAFNDVINANQDAETAVNNANRDTARILNDAQAYKEQVVREATGETQRFNSVYNEYRLAPQVTRDRLYLETMERVYRSNNLVILDSRGGAVPYLPLDMLRRNNGAAAATPQAQGGQ